MMSGLLLLCYCCQALVSDTMSVSDRQCLEKTALVAEAERHMAEDDMLLAQNSTAARSLTW